MLSYAHRDSDGYGATVAQSGVICTGIALPAGYFVNAQGADCNDSDAAVFVSVTMFADGDGAGAGSGQLACTDGSVPAGFVTVGGDCAPGDASAWQMLAYGYIDEDGDGAIIAASGEKCTGAALPLPYHASPSGNDCHDGDPAVTRFVVLYPDEDGDSIGASPRVISCIGDALPAGYSRHGYDPDDKDPSLSDSSDDALLIELL